MISDFFIPRSLVSERIAVLRSSLHRHVSWFVVARTSKQTRAATNTSSGSPLADSANLSQTLRGGRGGSLGDLTPALRLDGFLEGPSAARVFSCSPLEERVRCSAAQSNLTRLDTSWQ